MSLQLVKLDRTLPVGEVRTATGERPSIERRFRMGLVRRYIGDDLDEAKWFARQPRMLKRGVVAPPKQQTPAVFAQASPVPLEIKNPLSTLQRRREARRQLARPEYGTARPMQQAPVETLTDSRAADEVQVRHPVLY